jgi:hypothetical protein
VNDTRQSRVQRRSAPPTARPTGRGRQTDRAATPSTSTLRRIGELSVLALMLTPILLALVGVSVVILVLLASLLVS